MFKTWEEMSDKEQLECIVYEAYKDAYGFRPRHINFQAMSVAELKEDLAYLEGEIRRNEERRVEMEKSAIACFEARIVDTIAAGAADRETAIRWIRTAEDAEYGDLDFLCFTLGLPYGYLKEAA